LLQAGGQTMATMFKVFPWSNNSVQLKTVVVSLLDVAGRRLRSNQVKKVMFIKNLKKRNS